MRRVLHSALLYFALTFGAGFVLGTARVLWIAPLVGARAAVLAETPLMLLVSFVAARFVVRRLAVGPTIPARLGMGLMALALLLGCEFTMVLWLRGISIADYFRGLDPLSAGAYFGALAVFAVLPLFIFPAVGKPTRLWMSWCRVP